MGNKIVFIAGTSTVRYGEELFTFDTPEDALGHLRDMIVEGFAIDELVFYEASPRSININFG